MGRLLQRRTRQPRQLSPRPTRRRPESRQLRPPSRRPAVPERGRSRLVRQQRQTRSTGFRWLRLVARRLLLRLPRLPQRLPTRNLSRSRRLLMPSPLLTKRQMLPWSSVQLMGPSANQATNARRSTTRRVHTWPRTVSRAPLPSRHGLVTWTSPVVSHGPVSTKRLHLSHLWWQQILRSVQP